MRARTILLTTFLVAAWATCLSPAQTSPAQAPVVKADTIFVHGNFYTAVAGTSSFQEIQRAEALAVKDGRVLATGKTDDILKHKGPQTEVVDLGGHFAMPGFNDAHVHLEMGGLSKLEVDLTGVKSLDEFRSRVRDRVQKAAPGDWVIGSGWDHTLWPVKELPSRWDLDEVTGGHPAYFGRIDGHIGVANTRGLQLASITIASKDPQGGKIDRFESGEPTGILRETARDAIFAVIPKPDHDKRRHALELALQDATEHGVTSVQDNSSWEDFLILEELEKDHKLTVRVSEWLALDDSVDTLKSHREHHPASDLLLHTGMLKGFMDGSLGSRTAALLEPYSDEAKNSGLPRYEQGKLNALVKERVQAGFQIGLHAIGDRGIQMALDAFAEAAKPDAAKDATKSKDAATARDATKDAIKKPDYRFRIEHAQVTTAAQFARFKQLKVIASMQPSHLLTDMNWAQARLGEKRAATSYDWRDFLRHGVTLAFGTDFPVEPINPFRGLYAAVTRKSVDGKHEYFPEGRLSMDEAIAAYTQGPAYAEFAEKEKGKLAPGMIADFIVLDRDITAVLPARLLDTKVLRTVVGGTTVYQAK